MTDPYPGGPANPWPPASGSAPPPAYPQQVSAVPVGPVPGYPVAAAPAKTSPAVWVLLALAVLLFLGGGSVGALYASAHRHNDKLVSDRATTIDSLTDQADQLAKEKGDLDKQVTDAKSDLDEAQKSLDALNKCQDAINDFGVANKAAIDGVGTLAAVDAAFDAMVVACGAH